MALMFLVAAWRERAGVPTSRDFVLTVDHRLRAASAEEAAAVGRQAQRLGFRHDTLVWDAEKPAQGVSAAARDARYALIAQRCRELSLDRVLLAHTLDDQAETMIMRLARGSGVDGLSAMAPVNVLRGLVLVRPLLDVTRAHLRAYLAARGVTWFEDPSNEDEAYERVRVRKALAELEDLGLTRQALAASASRLNKVRSALDELTARAMAKHVRVHDAGFCVVSRALFHEESDVLAARVLGRCLMAVGGLEYPPKPEAVEALCAEMEQDDAAARTLGGCLLSVRADEVHVVREGRADCRRTRGCRRRGEGGLGRPLRCRLRCGNSGRRCAGTGLGRTAAAGRLGCSEAARPRLRPAREGRAGVLLAGGCSGRRAASGLPGPDIRSRAPLFRRIPQLSSARWSGADRGRRTAGVIRDAD